MGRGTLSQEDMSMATLGEIISAINEVLQDSTYTDTILTGKINVAVSRIAAGIRMPNGGTSQPLPDLFTYGTVNTSTTLPYVSLPANYQRNVRLVYDSTNFKIGPPQGGDYYSFALFMQIISNMGLAETGSIYAVAVKGTKVYYQGIPSEATTLGVHYYRKPVDMDDDTDTTDGIPDHLAIDLIKHYVLKEIMGEAIEDGQGNSGASTKYHTAKFFETMTDLEGFIGEDSEPQYYGQD